MNSVQLVGRLTRDPDVRYTDGGTTVARFTLAVDRRFKKDGGDEADFISCVAFGKTAGFWRSGFGRGNTWDSPGGSRRVPTSTRRGPRYILPML